MKPKILLLNPEANWGGAERCLWDLVIGALDAQAPYDFKVVLGGQGPLAQSLQSRGVDCKIVPLPEPLAQLGENGFDPKKLFSYGRAFLGYVNKLTEIVDSWPPDLVQTNGIKSHLLATFMTPPGTPLVWHMHDLLSSRRWSSELLRWRSRKVSAIITNSKTVQWDVSGIIPRCPTHIIHNGVDTVEFAPVANTPHEKIRIGLIGTYAKWKGHSLFLDAISLLRTAPFFDSLEFYLVGGPIYRASGSQFTESEIREMIERHDLQSKVTLVPFQEKIAPHFQALDIVVHASTQAEPFGRTVIEAMSCGKSVVAAGEGGPLEIIEDGKNGLLFQPRNPESLADQLTLLCRDSNLRKSLGSEARAHVEAKFSRARYWANFASFYSNLFHFQCMKSSQLKRKLVIAMGLRDDHWNSMRNYTQGLFENLTEDRKAEGLLGFPVLVAPSFHRKPNWIDRRLRYPKQIPNGQIFHLTDHSYADCLLSARRKYEKLVVVVHDLAFWQTRTSRNTFVRNRILKGIECADIRIADSIAIATELKDVFGLEVHAVIPPGVSPLFTHSESRRDPYLLVHVGDTSHRKGIERLLCFFKELPDHFRLAQVGGRFTQAQRNLITRLHLGDRIEEHGSIALYELVHLYHRASALVFPSRYEGFGIPVIEARACGTPVISSRSVPALEYLRHDAGTLMLNFDAFDSEGPSEAKLACLQQFNAFCRFPARLNNRHLFDWKTISHRYAFLYEKLL